MNTSRAFFAIDPQVVVCAGGGGVGKTTTAAALALALAKGGARTLLVTIDPARRLAGAMGVPISDELTLVPVALAGGRLYALMPDPRRSMVAFVDYLFAEQPEGKKRLLSNRLYKSLADAAAGVHELVAMNLVAQAASQGRFDVVVIDTAPSRHAIDFVTYPGRLASLLGGRTVAFFANMAQRAGEAPAAPSGGILSWGTDRVEAMLARVTGPNLLRDTASLFAELASVRERFVELTQRASTLLLGERTSYALVAAPTAAARDDVLFLAKRLEKLGRKPRALVLNRADTHAAPFVATLLGARGVSATVLDALTALENERVSRTAAAASLQRECSAALPGVPVVRLPYLEASAPEAIVLALCACLEPQLRTLLPAAW